MLADKKIIKVEVSKEHLKTLNEASTLLISLPGASLALVNEKYTHWGKTIEDTIEILQDLHNIKQIIFLDHRECGAYKKLIAEERLSTKEKETEAHTEILNKARKIIKEKFPQLKVYTFLMGLDGVIEQIYERHPVDC